jgi:hypothetical protein
LLSHHIAPDAQAVKPIVSAFIATGDDQPTPLAAENYAKYAPYVELVQQLDTAAMSAVYFKYAASFQQAYHDLTHTDARFDARVLEAIDSVLGAPGVREPMMVVRRDALYEFANPELESLPVGSKLMLRMGPTQASIVKSKLRGLRQHRETRHGVTVTCQHHLQLPRGFAQ